MAACSQNNSTDDNDASSVSYSDLWLAHKYYQVHDGWAYHTSYYGGKLLKSKLDGEEKSQIDNLKVDNFLINSNRLYYTALDGEMIYSSKSDGANPIYLTERMRGYRKMAMIDGWLYFQDYHYKLSRIDTDTLELTELSDRAIDYSIDNEWVYYVDVIINDKKIYCNFYRMLTDGTQIEKLTNDNCLKVDYNSDWIYYVDETGTNILKMRHDGSDIQTISDCNFKNRDFFKVIGNWIYFENSGEDPGIYKVNIDGSKKTKINEYIPDARHVNIYDNWLVYNFAHYDPYIIMVRIDDSHNTDDLIHEILTGIWPGYEIIKYE